MRVFRNVGVGIGFKASKQGKLYKKGRWLTILRSKMLRQINTLDNMEDPQHCAFTRGMKNKPPSCMGNEAWRSTGTERRGREN